MKKKILYLDLDGVIADFDKAIILICPELNTLSRVEREEKVDEVCQKNPYFFHSLPPIEGAIEATQKLCKLFDVYFLSTAMWGVPQAAIGKRLWVEEHFGELAKKRLILTHRKDLAIGDYLVDDRLHNGAAKFVGVHIHFATDKFPNWETTLAYLERVA